MCPSVAGPNLLFMYWWVTIAFQNIKYSTKCVPTWDPYCFMKYILVCVCLWGRRFEIGFCCVSPAGLELCRWYCPWTCRSSWGIAAVAHLIWLVSCCKMLSGHQWPTLKVCTCETPSLWLFPWCLGCPQCMLSAEFSCFCGDGLDEAHYK